MSERKELEAAVAAYAEAMKARLLSKKHQGWFGWEDLNLVEAQRRILDNIFKADGKSLVDVGNLAMMIWRQKK